MTPTTVDIAEQVRAIEDDLKPLLEFKAALEAEREQALLAPPHGPLRTTIPRVSARPWPS